MKRVSCLIIMLSTIFSCQKVEKQKKSESDVYDIAAYYWPNYHYEPRMEFLYKDRVGEWETVYNAKPIDSIERQPRVPIRGYENEANPKIMNEYIEMALDNGVNIFIFDWYWFDNKPFLERAIDSGFLRANGNRMKFYLMWANHDAVTYWDPSIKFGQDTIYWTGKVDRTIFDSIVDRTIDKYFKRADYYKIDGKPVYSIYEMNSLIDGLGGAVKTKEALDYFRQKVRKAGFPGLYLQAIQSYAFPDSIQEKEISLSDQNDVMNYFGFDDFTNYTWAHVANPNGDYETWADSATKIWRDNRNNFDSPYRPQVSVGWDNNPRFPADDSLPYINNSTPKKFKKYLIKAKHFVDSSSANHKLITINAWNEWTEGAYLLPDTLYKMGYLEAINDVFRNPN